MVLVLQHQPGIWVTFLRHFTHPYENWNYKGCIGGIGAGVNVFGHQVGDVVGRAVLRGTGLEKFPPTFSVVATPAAVIPTGRIDLQNSFSINSSTGKITFSATIQYPDEASLEQAMSGGFLGVLTVHATAGGRDIDVTVYVQFTPHGIATPSPGNVESHDWLYYFFHPSEGEGPGYWHYTVSPDPDYVVLQRGAQITAVVTVAAIATAGTTGVGVGVYLTGSAEVAAANALAVLQADFVAVQASIVAVDAEVAAGTITAATAAEQLASLNLQYWRIVEALTALGAG